MLTSETTLVRIIAPCCLVLLSALQAKPNDLAPLSDEFVDASRITEWSRVHEVEQWNADQLEIYDVNDTQPGRLVMMPYTSIWYQDWRGALAFKEVEGDFVITTEVHVTARDGVSIPGVESLFALSGLLIRTPRDITPDTWAPGGENFVFLSIGHGNNDPPTMQFEVKTTRDSVSAFYLTPAPANHATVQIARLGQYVITLRQEPDAPWQIHRRFTRPDFPDLMQVGLTTYTDWVKASVFDPFVHNSTVLDPPLPEGVEDPAPEVPFRPDIISGYEYVHYFRPTMPPHLEGLNLADENEVPDEELLAFLGEHANVPGGCTRDPAWVCDGDVDGDGQVNPVDSGLVQAAFGSLDDQDLCNYDLDCDGQINPVDSGIVQSLFGTCEEPRETCP